MHVSSKEQEKEGFSIPAQIKLLKDYAASRTPVRSFSKNAHRLFALQPPGEKSRMLNFLVPNCSWANGELSADFDLSRLRSPLSRPDPGQESICTIFFYRERFLDLKKINILFSIILIIV